MRLGGLSAPLHAAGTPLLPSGDALRPKIAQSAPLPATRPFSVSPQRAPDSHERRSPPDARRLRSTPPRLSEQPERRSQQTLAGSVGAARWHAASPHAGVPSVSDAREAAASGEQQSPASSFHGSGQDSGVGMALHNDEEGRVRIKRVKRGSPAAWCGALALGDEVGARALSLQGVESSGGAQGALAQGRAGLGADRGRGQVIGVDGTSVVFAELDAARTALAIAGPAGSSVRVWLRTPEGHVQGVWLVRGEAFRGDGPMDDSPIGGPTPPPLPTVAPTHVPTVHSLC